MTIPEKGRIFRLSNESIANLTNICKSGIIGFDMRMILNIVSLARRVELYEMSVQKALG